MIALRCLKLSDRRKAHSTMKFHPKRFVVEVKRGTSRAAFTTADSSVERFSHAEAELFGGVAKAEPERKQPAMAKSAQITGRILRSLVEPPPPDIPELPEPVRRGRKPGSKNKPKVQPPASLAGPSGDAVAERPRRGRKPGSKNKPKIRVAVDDVALPLPDGVAARAATASTPRSVGGEPLPDVTAAVAPPAGDGPPPSLEPRHDDAAGRSRPRFRDRSIILRRYVLKTEPLPGQPGTLRARRLARAAR